ncbi:response regulator transcription factor [Rhizobium sp. S152]|uniref:response regulator transcription factor n=1 Tax=Rhizobium sp. S152 TaxID=3055038 RepID=UPI0025A96E7F|nr:response regulator transcription factor [Rhizobium sp. S152]MDM9624958.1 response regulator transcription factor [Rhizobium sp. S152]
MRLLLVEDEVEMARALSTVLTQNQHVVDHFTRVEDAREAILARVHDVVILDRQLPDGDGLELLRDMRQAGDTTPVIVLTAFNAPTDRILGLDDGADDYLGKPFLAEELMARLRALARRPDSYASQVIIEGNVRFDLDHQDLFVKGEMVSLPRREMLVLQILMRRAGRTVLRGALEDAVYGYDDDIQSNALDSHVSRLRRRLVEAGANVSIHTVRGVGYLFKVSE